MELFAWNRTIFISRLPASNWTGRATGPKDWLVKQMDRSKKIESKKKLDRPIYRPCNPKSLSYHFLLLPSYCNANFSII